MDSRKVVFVTYIITAVLLLLTMSGIAQAPPPAPPPPPPPPGTPIDGGVALLIGGAVGYAYRKYKRAEQ